MKEKVAYIIPSASSFTEVDRDILLSRFDVLTIDLNQNKGRASYLAGLLNLIRQLFNNPGIKKVFIWFADYHAYIAVLLCRLLRKRSYLFIGGFDTVCYPEIGYGVFCHRWRRSFAMYALRHCDLIIANHEALILATNTYYRPEGHPDGIRHFIPDLKTSVHVVYNGINTDKVIPKSDRRQRAVLTVGGTPALADFYNKGYDLLIEVARRMPDTEFIFVGLSRRCVEHYDPIFALSRLANVRILHHLPHIELMELYSQVQVYAQPSISEGMPNAVMEAMLAGCIPVGSDVAGIPMLIGDCGFIVKRRNADELMQAINLALEATTHDACYRRIRECFDLAIRKDKIHQILG